MLDLIDRLTADSELLIECRHCGTAVSRHTTACPDCQGTEFARYDFSTG